MTKEGKKAVAIFKGQKIRRHWDEEKGLWYFSVVDVIGALTGSSIPKRYWSDLKKKLKGEGSQVYENIVQLKFKASDGKNYATDCFSTEDMLRLIQSVPSPNAEPFKIWLAKVGYQRLEETADPELAMPERTLRKKPAKAQLLAKVQGSCKKERTTNSNSFSRFQETC